MIVKVNSKGIIVDQNSIGNEIFMKWPVVTIKHHEEDWRPGYRVSYVDLEPKSNFRPFLP